MSKILDDGMHELQILAFIWKEAEKIEAYLSFVKSGVSPFDAAEKSGVPVNSREDFVKRVSSYSVEHVKNIFSMLAKADSSVKSAKNAGPLGTIMLNPLMELTEFFLCRGK